MMIDMHHHLIYGIDDGARSFESTVKMLREAVANDVEAIVTTPHITPGQVANTQYALVEFSPDDSFDYILRSVESIASAGYVPVVAHVERYDSIKKPAQLSQLRRSCNALIQVNAGTVVRKHKFFRERYLHKIFSEGLVDFVSTDSHDLPGRSNKLKAACEKLTEEYGEDLARALTHDNAERILLESSR